MLAVRAMFVLAALQLGDCSQLYSAFEGASASSVFSAGAASGAPLYAPIQATSSAAGGYWSSAGGHGQSDVVSWTGVLGAKLIASGVRLGFAYSPSELKVLVSGDGVNFVEAADWQPSARDEVSFTEFVMFEGMIPVRAITILMRGPRAWGYFGLSNIALLTEPGAVLVVSGATSLQPRCLVRDISEKQVVLAPCVDSIATGMGREVFELSDAGTLASTTSPGHCMALAGAEAVGGGSFVLKPCGAVGIDGRFSFSSSGQLRLAGLGNYCVTSDSSGKLLVRDCDEASGDRDARDQFYVVATSTADTRSGSAVLDATTLANAAAARLTNSVSKLSAALASCSLLSSDRALQNTTYLIERRSSSNSEFAELISHARALIAKAT